MDLIKQAENLETKSSGYDSNEDAKDPHGHRADRILSENDQTIGSVNVTTEDDEELALGFKAQNETSVVAP